MLRICITLIFFNVPANLAAIFCSSYISRRTISSNYYIFLTSFLCLVVVVRELVMKVQIELEHG